MRTETPILVLLVKILVLVPVSLRRGFGLKPRLGKGSNNGTGLVILEKMSKQHAKLDGHGMTNDILVHLYCCHIDIGVTQGSSKIRLQDIASMVPGTSISTKISSSERSGWRNCVFLKYVGHQDSWKPSRFPQN